MSVGGSVGPQVESRNSSLAVLLVDDHDLVRFGLRRMIEEMGFEGLVLLEARSLTEAVGLFARNAIQVVILDLNLPDTKGLSGLRTFKQAYPASRVIVLSGSVDDAISGEALSIGAEAFLNKTTDSAQLRKSLRELILGSGSDGPPEEAAAPGVVSAASAKRLTLSTRELQILDLVLQGFSTREIAEETGLSRGTVKNYVSSLLAVFGVTTRTKLVALFH